MLIFVVIVITVIAVVLILQQREKRPDWGNQLDQAQNLDSIPIDYDEMKQTFEQTKDKAKEIDSEYIWKYLIPILNGSLFVADEFEREELKKQMPQKTEEAKKILYLIQCIVNISTTYNFERKGFEIKFDFDDEIRESDYVHFYTESCSQHSDNKYWKPQYKYFLKIEDQAAAKKWKERNVGPGYLKAKIIFKQISVTNSSTRYGNIYYLNCNLIGFKLFNEKTGEYL